MQLSKLGGVGGFELRRMLPRLVRSLFGCLQFLLPCDLLRGDLRCQFRSLVGHSLRLLPRLFRSRLCGLVGQIPGGWLGDWRYRKLRGAMHFPFRIRRHDSPSRLMRGRMGNGRLGLVLGGFRRWLTRRGDDFVGWHVCVDWQGSGLGGKRLGIRRLVWNPNRLLRFWTGSA